MTTTEILCRHFSRMGARLKIQEPRPLQREKVRIDVSRDRGGEYFDIRCRDGLVPELVDVQPAWRRLVLMVRDGRAKSKFLLGHDERHWFAAAVPGEHVRDVRSAMESLRPVEVQGRTAIRQGEWFFTPEPKLDGTAVVVHRNEPLSRGAGSKPHMCDEVTRRGGTTVMVSRWYPQGIEPARYERLITYDARARSQNWTRMTVDADVFARGCVRHSDHKTIYLDSWHRVYMNRERVAPHAMQIAFLD